MRAQVQERPIEVLGERLHTFSPRALGATGLVSGLIALGSVILGFQSWMLLGTALVVWILSGWAIFFQTAPRRPVISALGTIMFASALAAAVAVLAGLYLAALGPSWIL